MRTLTFCLIVLGTCRLFAQTGPGGVGNSTTVPLWLKANAGTSTTANGLPVSSWNDASGNGNHALQATTSKQPLFVAALINGMPALFFDNIGSPNNDEMAVADNSNLDNTNGVTILTVTRPVSIDNSTARGIVSKRTDVGTEVSYTMFYFTSNHVSNDIVGSDNRFPTVTTFVPSRDYVTTLLYDGTLAAATRSKVYVNENLDVTSSESASTIPDNPNPLAIGAMHPGDGRPFGGYIAEVVVYRKALNVAERVIAHNYLFSKYGISSTSIPATTNDLYAGDNAGNGDYDFEVAGIGTEASGSNTTASTAVAGGMGIAQVSGFGNGDYLLYGHLAGGNTNQTTDVGGMTGSNNGRWTRMWYVDITNASTVQTVNITFDMSDGGTGVTPVTASNYVLLTRAGQSGNWTEVTTASSIVGDVISFPNIVVSADGYYTLGSRNYIVSPLPVGLLSFGGDLTEKGVELRWTTATEWNNDRFTIERSPDGYNFEHMAVVTGSGNRIEETNYEVLDPKPFGQRTYYRLTQTDFDGTTTNLKTIAVATGESLTTIEVIPNPSNGSFWFDVPSNVIKWTPSIINSAGQRIQFDFSTLGSRVSVDAQNLPKGLYVLKLVSDRGIHTTKFLVE